VVTSREDTVENSVNVTITTASIIKASSVVDLNVADAAVGAARVSQDTLAQCVSAPVISEAVWPQMEYCATVKGFVYAEDANVTLTAFTGENCVRIVPIVCRVMLEVTRSDSRVGRKLA